ncbi:MAG: HXXEE domain-containing protein [Terriglobales bacterium]|jgi:hypothetical protein
MNLGDSNRRFGICWLFFGYTLALHVLDEAGNDFLSVYNPNALAIRRALLLPIPTLTLQTFIASLLCVLTLWLALTPLAFRGSKSMRRLAIPVAAVGGIANALAHLGSSIYYRRFMPGVYSAPLILFSGIVLLRVAVSMARRAPVEED